MAKDPAFLFYYQDFFTGVSDLTNEEVGAYIRCLCVQSSKGGITEKHMKIICNSSDVHNSIKNKFRPLPNSDLLHNERLAIEVEKRKNYVISRASNRKGKFKNKNICKSYVPHMEDENEDENIKENINIIFDAYKQINSKATLTDKGRFKIKVRLKNIGFPTCLDAIEKFIGNRWRMENNSDKTIAWFFASDEKVMEWIGLKQDTPKAKVDMGDLLNDLE